MPYVYKQMVAFDQSGSVLRSGTGQIYDETGSALLAVTDLAGVPLTDVDIDATGLTQAFIAEAPEAMWISGPFRVPLSSARGMREAAEQAAQSAASAQTSAQTAAQAAQNAAIAAQEAAELAAGAVDGNGGGGSGDGNLFVMPVWNGIGTQPGRVYPSWHPRSGQSIPNAPAVFVKWRQPDFPIGVAQEGDEFRRTGG